MELGAKLTTPLPLLALDLNLHSTILVHIVAKIKHGENNDLSYSFFELHPMYTYLGLTEAKEN
jgi:hypothetical protein